MFNGCFAALQYGPFRHAKWPISGAEKHHIALQYRLYRTVKWALSERKTDFYRLSDRVYQNAVLSEMSLILSDLTFVYTSFAKIFCQNKVKKNCKLVGRFPFFLADIGRGTMHGIYVLLRCSD